MDGETGVRDEDEDAGESWASFLDGKHVPGLGGEEEWKEEEESWCGEEARGDEDEGM